MAELNYSGKNTILYLLQYIKNNFVGKVTGKDLSTNDYTTAEKNKLAGLSNYTLPTASASTKGGIKVGAGLQMEGDVLSTSSVTWSGVVGKPDASTNIETDSTNTTKYATPSAVASYVNSKVSSALMYSGSTTFASLPALSADNVGKVYNITDGFTTTANFTEGAGHTYTAGQNVAVAKMTDGTYKYDVLAGAIDLTPYVENSDMNEISNEELKALWEQVFGTTEG